MARDELLDPNPNFDEQVEAPLTGRRSRPGSGGDIDISVDMSMDSSANSDPSSGDTGIGLDDNGLRPKTLEDFVGQAELKERLSIILEAARGRQQAADHLLFAGPPGLGKTTLAGIVANELNAQLQITSGPAIERAGDLASILTNLEPGGVLFIDEIHRLPRVVEEVLYPAMEDLQIDVIVGKGPVARSIRFDLEPFTLVGATTRTGLITGPLRDRFGFDFRLDFYDVADLERIVLRAGAVMGIDVEPDGASEIAGRSRGTPRIANRLLRRVRDYSEVRGHGVINRETAADGLALFGVDERGLGKVDRTLLSNLCERFSGGPVGLSTLAISVAEPAETVEDVIEPFLIQQGLLIRTPRGRVATAAAWRHIGLKAPDESLVAPDVTTLFD